ncbi:MAG: CBS domain-containing protein [Bryobacteraceae bacterium]
MRFQEIMTKDVSFYNPGTNAAAATEIMWTRNCGSLPIVEDGQRVVGMVTDRDLLIALGTSNRNAADLLVGEVMSKDLALCAPNDDVRQALKTMAERQLHRLLVVDEDGALKGSLSLDDIALRADADGISKDLLKTMKAVCDLQNQRAEDPFIRDKQGNPWMVKGTEAPKEAAMKVANRMKHAG